MVKRNINRSARSRFVRDIENEARSSTRSASNDCRLLAGPSWNSRGSRKKQCSQTEKGESSQNGSSTSTSPSASSSEST
jgi:hypothetical protein